MSERAKTPDGYPLAPSPVTIMDATGRVIARVEPGTRTRIDAKTGARANMFPAAERKHRAYPPHIERETVLASLVPIRRNGIKRGQRLHRAPGRRGNPAAGDARADAAGRGAAVNRDDAHALRGALLHLRLFLNQLNRLEREDLLVVDMLARSEQWLRALPGADIEAAPGRLSRRRLRTPVLGLANT